jgi:transcriptional regulatory protein LevR
MSTPLGIMGIARFMWKTAKQLASTQGPAYIKFLGRVMLYRQSMFREALGLAAKGYHLRKITEQITAVDSLQHYLTHVIASLQNQLTRAHSEERKVQMKAHARYAIARALNEYLAIHRDFRDGVVDALAKFDADLRDIFSEANLPRLTS